MLKSVMKSGKLHLNGVTLVCVDCLCIEKALRSLMISCHYCGFDDVKFLTSDGPKNSIKIPKITSKKEYSEFVVRELHKYINTPYLLIVQHDGWILNPNVWDDSWYGYDYLGSNVTWMDKKGGNGGFSFRSKRSLIIGNKVIEKGKEHPEDAAYSAISRKKTGFRIELEKRGLVFADKDTQRRFGCNRKKWCGSFGHHCADLRNWKNSLLNG